MKNSNLKTPNTNYLDILFANRNKAYGAYELRKNYNKRLMIPILILFLFTSIGVITADRRKVIDINRTKKIPIVITPIKEIEKPKKPEEKKVHEAVKTNPKTTATTAKNRNTTSATARPLKLTITDANDIPPVDSTKFVASTDPNPNPNPNPGKDAGNPGTGTPGLTGGTSTLPSDSGMASNLPEPKDVNKKYTTEGVDQEPIFPGGTKALDRFLADNLIYPSYSIENEREGKVVLEFVVNEKGSITEVKIIDKAFPEMNTEALRVINKMPNWKPALYGGEPVKCLFRVPITFELDNP